MFESNKYQKGGSSNKKDHFEKQDKYSDMTDIQIIMLFLSMEWLRILLK